MCPARPGPARSAALARGLPLPRPGRRRSRCVLSAVPLRAKPGAGAPSPCRWGGEVGRFAAPAPAPAPPARRSAPGRVSALQALAPAPLLHSRLYLSTGARALAGWAGPARAGGRFGQVASPPVPPQPCQGFWGIGLRQGGVRCTNGMCSASERYSYGGEAVRIWANNGHSEFAGCDTVQ